MPPARPPVPPSPTAAKVAALIGWYVLICLLLWRAEISAKEAIIAGGGPLGVVLGFRVSDWLRAIVLKR